MDGFDAALIRVLLGGSFKKSSMMIRLRKALRFRVSKAVIGKFAEEVLSYFPNQKTTPDKAALLRVIPQVFMTKHLLSSYILGGNPNLRYINTLSPLQESIHEWALPHFETTQELADWLKISLKDLDWLSGRITQRKRIDSRYRIRFEHQHKKKVRLFEIPCRRLKAVQRVLLEEILEYIPPHEASHGFRRGHSIKSYVTPHVGQAVVWRTDLANFFLSISRARVFGLFRMLQYPEAVAGTLANLMTNKVPQHLLTEHKDQLPRDTFRELHELLSNRHLPQGAPTSPALANLITFRLDSRLSGLAQTFGANYTRYADDLAFSGSHDFKKQLPRFRQYALAIILSEGFAIRQRKSVVMSESGQQKLAGVVVNTRPNISRVDYKQLHAILHNCIVHGPTSQNREGHPDFRNHLLGKISYASHLNPQRGKKLMALFNRIEW